MKELCEIGFFQDLHLYFHSYVLRTVGNYPPYLLSFVKILHSNRNVVNVTPLVNLERLFIADASEIGDLDTGINSLAKLKFISFIYAKIEDILPFIRQLSSLKKIKIYYINYGIYFNDTNDILNLSALDDERKKCPNAGKITFYLKENIYLATKFAFKKSKLNFIEIKRRESYEKNLDFAFK